VKDENIRRRLRQALDVEPPDPSLRARVMASLPMDTGDEQPGRRWLVGAMALLLAVSVVTGLLYARSVRDGSVQTGGPDQASLVPIGSAQVVTATDFHCRLPLATGRGGVFLSLPDGRLSLDPANTSDAGAVRGYYAGGHWVSPRPQVAPDGSAYAYATIQKVQVPPHPISALHVVDTASGTDRVVWQGDGYLTVIGFAPGVIYGNLTDVGSEPNRAGLGGLQAFDIKGGGQRRVQAADDQANYTSVGGGAAWAATFSRAPGAGDAGGAISGPDSIRRLDLVSGSASVWNIIPAGYSASIAGFDFDGHPLIRLSPNLPSSQVPAKTTPAPSTAPYPATTLYLLLAPNQLVPVTGDAALAQAMPVADRHGIWFAGKDGSVWLYSQPAGMRRVAQIDPNLLAATRATQASPAGKAGYAPVPEGLRSVAGACT
jgi:hypothetical protein